MSDVTLGLELGGHRRMLRFPDMAMAKNFAVAAVQPLLEPSDEPLRIVDVGACVGGWTLAQSMVVTQASFDCFEPWPPAWGYFRANTDWHKRITLHRQAASDQKGMRNMMGDATNFGKTSLYGLGEARAVDTVRLDDVLTGPINLLKIDAEGHEMKVLAGAQRILRQERPPVLVEVLVVQMKRGGWTEYDLKSFMTAQGYGAPQPATANDWLFQPTEKRLA